MTTTLAILLRAPERGRVKTRLAATLGQDEALDVYLALLECTAHVAARWTGPVELHVDGDPLSLQRTSLSGFPAHRQVAAADLGPRLTAAAIRGTRGGRRVVVIGSDCPDLRASDVGALADAAGAGVAIGPARDGGYWGIAIGAPPLVRLCFGTGLPWSTDRLLAATLARLHAAGARPALGRVLDDIDDLGGLRRAEARGFRWHRAPAGPASVTGTSSPG